MPETCPTQVHQNIETQLSHHRTSLLNKFLLANVPQNIPSNDIIQFIINLYFIQLKAYSLGNFRSKFISTDQPLSGKDPWVMPFKIIYTISFGF